MRAWASASLDSRATMALPTGETPVILMGETPMLRCPDGHITSREVV